MICSWLVQASYSNNNILSKIIVYNSLAPACGENFEACAAAACTPLPSPPPSPASAPHSKFPPTSASPPQSAPSSSKFPSPAAPLPCEIYLLFYFFLTDYYLHRTENVIYCLMFFGFLDFSAEIWLRDSYRIVNY